MRTRSAALGIGLLFVAFAATRILPANVGRPATSGSAQTYYEKARAFYLAKPPDYNNAAVWYLKAATLGHAGAQNDLGWLYQKGWGVPGDVDRAAYWYRQAAAKRDATGQANLGSMYEHGTGVPQDYAEAARWYRLGASGGNAIAADNLGVLYRDGRGVPRDYAEAVVWFQQAAAAGLAVGQLDLGWMCHNGWGVARNYVEAMKWYRLAAAQGNALAENNIGVLYGEGLGVPRDLDQATAWYRKAADGGEPRAQQSLRRLLSFDRGMAPWQHVLAGRDIGVVITPQGIVYLYAAALVRLPYADGGNAIDVEVPVKTFTDAELRELGILGSDGSLSISGKPHLPYKPMRPPTETQLHQLFEHNGQTAIAIHWPPYIVFAPEVAKLGPTSRDAVRETIERLYEE